MEEKDLEQTQVEQEMKETDSAAEIQNEQAAEKQEKSLADTIPAKWYVLHTFSGYENVAKKNLETVVEKFNLQDRIFDIVIPMEDVVEEKKWQEKTSSKKINALLYLCKNEIW